MKTIIEKISTLGIVPVVKIDNIDTAIPLARALCEGRLPCAEVTFRTSEAEEAIRLMTKEFPKMLIGAGTVLTTEQVDRAIDAGARFIVSPGLNPKVVKYCLEKNIPIIPGTSNASDIESAIELGLDVVKFFPAEINGGIKAIKALAAPYTTVKFMPTGGVSKENLVEYLSFEKVIACGGSWMVDSALINAGNFDKIKSLTEQAVHTMLGFELAHIGINSENAETASSIANDFTELLGLPKKDGNSNIFCGTAIEVIKLPYLGKNGHIAIKTNSVIRARAYLESKGYEFLADTEKKNENGIPLTIYLKNEFGGFAVHLLQK